VVRSGGATVVGLRFKDGVIIAGERKVTHGTFVVSTRAKKVFLLNGRLAIGFAGVIADAQGVLRILSEELRYYQLSAKQTLSVEGTAKLLSRILYSNRLFPILSEALVGGIDGEQPKLVVLDPLGSTISDDFAAVGTGAEIAIGVLEEGYSEDMSIEGARSLLLKSLRASAKRDVLSGSTVDLAIVTKSGAREEVVTLG